MITQSELETFRDYFKQIDEAAILSDSIQRLIQEHTEKAQSIKKPRSTNEIEYICFVDEIRLLKNLHSNVMCGLRHDFEFMVEKLEKGDILDSDD